jgi:hypothetical protein
MTPTTKYIIAGALPKISITVVGRERAVENIASGRIAMPKNKGNIGAGGTAIPVAITTSIKKMGTPSFIETWDKRGASPG